MEGRINQKLITVALSAALIGVAGLNFYFQQSPTANEIQTTVTPSFLSTSPPFSITPTQSVHSIPSNSEATPTPSPSPETAIVDVKGKLVTKKKLAAANCAVTLGSDTVTTAKDGSFTLTNILSGTYVLTVSCNKKPYKLETNATVVVGSDPINLGTLIISPS